MALEICLTNGEKKRGSLSRAKSTPKEEGGGDKSEPGKIHNYQLRSVRFAFSPKPKSGASYFCAPHKQQFY